MAGLLGTSTQSAGLLSKVPQVTTPSVSLPSPTFSENPILTKMAQPVQNNPIPLSLYDQAKGPGLLASTVGAVKSAISSGVNYLTNTNQTNPLESTLQFGKYLAPGIPAIAHGLTTGDWKPYTDMINQRGINAQNLANPDPAIHGPEAQKLMTMVLGMSGDAIPAEAPTQFGNFSSQESSQLVTAAERINSGTPLSNVDWTAMQNIIDKGGYEIPSTQAKAAQMILDARNSAESRAFETVMSESLDRSTPTTAEYLKSQEASQVAPKPIQGRLPNGWFDKIKKLFSDQRGMIKNPLAGGEVPPEEVPAPESLPNPNTPSDIGTPQPGEIAPNEAPPTPEVPTLEQSGISGEATPAPSALKAGQSLPNGTTPNLKINPDNLNISPEAKTLLDNLSEDVSPKTAAKVGKVMSNQEVIDFAKANPNLSLNQVSRDASLKANAAMLEARQTLAAQMEALQNGDVTAADKADIIKNFLAVKTTATDLGRSLQKLSVSADPTEGSTISDIIAKIAKTGASVDDIIAAAKNVDFNDYNQVVSFYRQFVKPSAGDWIDLVRYNSMLSSPLTLSNISAGNAFNIATQPVVKSTAGALDWLKTGVFGGEQTHFIGEGPAYVKGAAQNIGKAFSNFTDVISGNLDPKMLDFNVPIAAEGKEGLLVKSMNIFSTLHNAMYQFFNTVARGGSDASIAYKAAQGVETPLPDIAAQAEADYATFRAGTNVEGEGNVLNAIDSVASAFKRWSASDNPALAWPTKITLPFLRISTNMAKQMLEYSPAGFVTIPGAEDGITQFAKATLGTATFAAIGTMAATGNITGAAPTVPGDKNAFLASGRQPYSVKIGNNWISYNKLPPSMSIPMLLAATYVQSQASGQGKDKIQSVLDAFASFGKYLADQSYVKNIGDLVAAIQGDTSKGNPIDTLVTNDAQQLIPFRAFSGWLAKLMDPNQRQIDTSKNAINKQLQLFMEQIPGLREQIPAKLDSSGNPIPNPNRVLNAFSPFQVSGTSPAKEQSFQDYLTLKGISANAAQKAKDLTTQAQQTWQQLLKLPKDQAKAQLKQLAQTNPDLATKIISLIKTDAKTANLDATETKLLNSSTEARAQYIAQQVTQYNTKDEYKAYLKDLAAKKILTADTLKRLTELLNPK